MRSHKKIELENLKQEIKRVFNKIAKMYNGKMNINFTKITEGYTYPQHHPNIRKLSETASCKFKPLITNSGSDTNIFHEHKINVVELYHGIQNTHTVQEKVSINTIMSLFFW